MDDLVAEHVIGVGQRRRKRQRNPSLPPFSHSGGAAVDEPGDDQGLVEIRLRAVEDDRLTPGQLVLEKPRETPPPSFRETSGDIDGLAPVLVEVNVEVLGLQNAELMAPVLNLVLAEVLR